MVRHLVANFCNEMILFLHSIGADCPSFSVDYGGQRCFKMDRNTQGRGDTLAPRDGTNYFEKVCLRGEISGCRDKAWAFERMPGFQLVGYNTKGKNLDNSHGTLQISIDTILDNL